MEIKENSIPIDWDKIPDEVNFLFSEANTKDAGVFENLSAQKVIKTSLYSNKDDNVWSLTEEDVEKISIGAAILGCGGGGNPYLGKLRVFDQLRQGKNIDVISIDK